LGQRQSKVLADSCAQKPSITTAYIRGGFLVWTDGPDNKRKVLCGLDWRFVPIAFVQGSSFSTSGVGDANAAARAAKDGSSLHAKSASATFPYTYPAASTLQLVSMGDKRRLA